MWDRQPGWPRRTPISTFSWTTDRGARLAKWALTFILKTATSRYSRRPRKQRRITTCRAWQNPWCRSCHARKAAFNVTRSAIRLPTKLRPGGPLYGSYMSPCGVPGYKAWFRVERLTRFLVGIPASVFLLFALTSALPGEPGRVQGIVSLRKGDTHRPFAKVYVTLHSAGSAKLASTRTGSDGSFQFVGIWLSTLL